MKNVVEYKTARTTEYALLTQPIINDNRNRREEKPEVPAVSGDLQNNAVT